MEFRNRRPRTGYGHQLSRVLGQEGLIQGVHVWEFGERVGLLKFLGGALGGGGPHGRPNLFYRDKHRLSIELRTQGLAFAFRP
jgi:hypothetical protein